MRTTRWIGIAAVVPLLVAAAACGGSDGDAAAPTTVAPTTEAAPTTVAPTTTPAPTTTLEPLPVPAGVPDPATDEPVIQVGHVAIPRLAVDMEMYEGVADGTLDHGPGHWPGTAAPGQLGNVVIAGHRVSKHRVFRNLDQLVAGDEIVLTDALGAAHTYTVTGAQIVDPTALWIVDQTRARTATLFSCHPPGSTRQRIVVTATLKDAA